MNSRASVRCGAFIAVLLTAAWCAGEPPSLRAAERAAKLSRGVNIPHWFWYAEDDSAAVTARYITDADVRQLKGLGVTHVRIPIEPEAMWDLEKRELRAERVADYLSGIEKFTSAGVAVVVDPHPSRTAWAQATAPEFERDYREFWGALAGAMKATDPKLVFLEVMNEPHDIKDAAAWPAWQAKFVETIRAAAPKHTIIATGDSWGSIEGLLRLKPLADANVIYSFHFYEPHTFTHQGATWGAPNWKNLSKVPYPADDEAVIQAAVEGAGNEAAKGELRWYGKQEWNAGKIKAEIAKAAAWGKEHGAVVWCGEFGVYRKVSEAGPREAWLRDVTAALREFGIGWCMWDYAGGFALVEGEAGKRKVFEGTAKAVGLGTSSSGK